MTIIKTKSFTLRPLKVSLVTVPFLTKTNPKIEKNLISKRLYNQNIMKLKIPLLCIVFLSLIISVSGISECKDSDGGKNYYEKGETYDRDANNPFTDKCLKDYPGGDINDKKLMEHWCGDDGRLKGEPYECEEGCEEGACTVDCPIMSISCEEGSKIEYYTDEYGCRKSKCVSGKDIYDFIDDIVDYGGYTIVIGDDGPSTDTIAAGNINVKFQQYSNLKTNLNVELSSLVRDRRKLILIGHPCDNPLITEIKCDDWNYEDGSYLIKISGNHLIIAGSTGEDTKKAAEIVANFRNHNELKNIRKLFVGEIKKEYPVMGDEEKVLEEKKQKKEKDKIACNGCLDNLNNCIPITVRIEDKFCDIDKKLKEQQKESGLCNNNYECGSNVCVNNQCISKGFLEKILSWFRNIFR